MAQKQNRSGKGAPAGGPSNDGSKLHPDNLLVVYDDALSSSYLFEKAQLLAGPATRVHVVQVIHEGIADLSVSAIENSAQLKSFLLESAENELEEQLFRVRSRLPGLESATLWNSRHWEGVLHAAAETDADLILKAADEKQSAGVRALVRTPSEWNLLRHSKVPVMIVKPQAWPKEPTLLCAFDVFDDAHQTLNLDLLVQSAHLAQALSGDLNLVCAYPLFEPWVGELGAVKSYEEIKDAVEQDIRDRVARLVKKAGIRYRNLILEEGHAAQALTRISEEAEAALLILGTHAREGVGGVLLGNTSERILHAVDTDVLTVPLRSRRRAAKTPRRGSKSSPRK